MAANTQVDDDVKVETDNRGGNSGTGNRAKVKVAATCAGRSRNFFSSRCPLDPQISLSYRVYKYFISMERRF